MFHLEEYVEHQQAGSDRMGRELLHLSVKSWRPTDQKKLADFCFNRALDQDDLLDVIEQMIINGTESQWLNLAQTDRVIDPPNMDDCVIAETGVFKQQNDSVRVTTRAGIEPPPAIPKGDKTSMSIWHTTAIQRAGGSQSLHQIISDNPSFLPTLKERLSEQREQYDRFVQTHTRIGTEELGRESVSGDVGVGQNLQRETLDGRGQDSAESGGQAVSGDPDESGEAPGGERRGGLPAGDELANAGGVSPQRHRITADKLDIPSGDKTRARQNIEAIRLLRAIGDRPATPEEQEVLSQYVGWGGLPGIFDEGKKAWESDREQLASLLTQEEYDSARASTPDAHYTSLSVIRAMYQTLDRAGYRGTGKVLEASCGVGHFMGLAPRGQTTDGIELDRISAAISAKLYPDSDIQQGAYQDQAIAEESYDLVVGNPPFGQTRPHTEDKRLKNHALHNYFIHRGLIETKPGGMAAFVTSRYFLDSQDSSVREAIGADCDLVSAVRLPGTAFSGNANTDVVTDIVVFRKRLPEDRPLDLSWVSTDEVIKEGADTDEPGRINSYINADHANRIVGDLAWDGSMYRAHDLNIKSELGEVAIGQEAAKLLARQLDGREFYAPANERPASDRYMARDELPPMSDRVATTGGFFYDPKNDRVYLSKGSRNRYVNVEECRFDNATDKRRVLELIQVRDSVRRLRDMEVDPSVEADTIERQRQSLREKVWGFEKRFAGDFASRKNRRLFFDDPDSALVFSLLRGERKTQDANEREAPLLQHRISFPQRTPEITGVAETIDDALRVSLVQTGGIDIPLIAEALKQDVTYDDVTELLDKSDHAVRDPLELDKFLTPQVFLSRNLYDQMDICHNEPLLVNTLQFCRDNLPEPVGFDDIAIGPTSSLLTDQDLEDFVYEHFDANCQITRQGGLCEVNFLYDKYRDRAAGNRSEYPLTRQWGVLAYNRPFHQILEHMFTGKTPKVTTNGEINRNATQQVEQAIKEMADEFNEWIKDIPRERQIELAHRYNRSFNAHGTVVYDGDHMPHDNLPLRLRKNQRDGVWRATQQKSLLINHAVGAGKTAIAIVAEKQKQQLGMIKKSMIVVPNHLVTHWTDEIMRIYPDANVIAPEITDMRKDKRKELMGQMVTGDWDFIVMPMSQFNLIPLSAEQQHKKFEKKMAEEHRRLQRVEEKVAESHEQGGERYNDYRQHKSVKRIEKAMKKHAEDLKRQLSKNVEEDLVTWDQLGVDSLVIDESHAYKNLPFQTEYRGLGGLGTPGGAKRAVDLDIKIDNIRERDGFVTFMTATPISNSLVECYHLFKYLQPDWLREANVESVDDWLSIFAKIGNTTEVDLTGSQFISRKKCERFVNLPELQRAFGRMTDTRTKAQLEEEHQREHNSRWPVPKMTGGKPTLVRLPRSSAQATGTESLIQRMGGMKGVDPREDNALKVLTDGTKLAMDARMLCPDAPANPQSKTAAASRNIIDEYHKWEADKGAQLVFADTGTPKSHREEDFKRLEQLQARANSGEMDAGQELIQLKDELFAQAEGGFDVYNDLKLKLVQGGIPAEEIAFIHDYPKDADRQKLYEKVNRGDIRVLLGSTSKMGTGMNVQERLVAAHFLDVPWTPKDMEQRRGRLFRPGNKLYARDGDSFEAPEYIYVTQRTSDAKKLQIVETKMKFLEQFQCGDNEKREMEDLSYDASTMDISEMRAMTSNNPLMEQEVTLHAKRIELERGEDRRLKLRRQAEQTVKYYDADRMERMKRGYATLVDQIEPQSEKHSWSWRKPDGEIITEGSKAYLAELLPPTWTRGRRIVGDEEIREVGQYGGFNVSVGRQPGDNYYAENHIAIYLKHPDPDVEIPNALQKELTQGVRADEFNTDGFTQRVMGVINRIPRNQTKYASLTESLRTDYENSLARLELPDEPATEYTQIVAEHEAIKSQLGVTDSSQEYQSEVPKFDLQRDGSGIVTVRGKRQDVSLPPDEDHVDHDSFVNARGERVVEPPRLVASR